MGFVCVHANNTLSCDDGDDCTMNDVCAGGTCGGVPLDGDEDGYVSDECGGNDCDDSDPNVHPGFPEGPPEDPVCMDGIDNNCNGYTDDKDIGCQPEVDWSAYSEADASTVGSGTRAASSISNLFLSLMLPIGVVMVLRRVFRRR